MKTVALARHAMASRFELILHGEDEIRLRAAGEEVLHEIDRIESQLSLYRPSSEIAHLNARASREPVRVSAPVFALLRHALQLAAETGGAFDITMGPLTRCWGFMDGRAVRPTPEQVAEAQSRTGFQHVELNEADGTVRFHRPGLMIDLGAIGKGYAVEQAIELLREAGIDSCLLHGGTSTVYALGTPPDRASWKIGIEDPGWHQGAASPESAPPLMCRMPSAAVMDPSAKSTRPLLFEVELQNQALSVSSPAGKCYQAEGKTLGHVIDPRTGEPVSTAALAAVVTASATESDALSTALLVLGAPGVALLARLRPGIQTWLR